MGRGREKRVVEVIREDGLCALVIALGALELTGLQRWEQGGEIACGLWLIVSPFIFGYAEADALRYWHFVLGALVAWSFGRTGI